MLMKMYPSTTCVITLIALLGMYPCQADDPIYATIDECTGTATLELIAHGSSGDETASDEDSVGSFDELAIRVQAAAGNSLVYMDCDMLVGGTITGDNTFELRYRLNSHCAFMCNGCWLEGSGDIFLDIDLMIHRPTKLILSSTAYWEFTQGSELTLARPGEEPRMLHDNGGWIYEDNEIATFEIQSGTHVLKSWIPYMGCGPYEGSSQSVGGFLDFTFEFVASDLPADLNLDGQVDGADLTILLGNWGEGYVPGDINGDGVVSGSDLAEILGSWT